MNKKASNSDVRKLSRLKPLPIDFDEERHEYTWEPTGARLAYSVTQILRVLKTEWQLQMIEKSKATWAPRGTSVHAGLEAFLNGKPAEQVLADIDEQWLPWLEPLLAHPFWQVFTPIATEYRVCDLARSIGGSLDALGWYAPTESLVLLDLKTLGKRRKPYSTDAQLGGYLSMLIDQKKLVVDDCLTFWSMPGEAEHGDPQPPQRCLDAWEDAYSKWSLTQEEL